jgi:hypothetical protein
MLLGAHAQDAHQACCRQEYRSFHRSPLKLNLRFAPNSHFFGTSALLFSADRLADSPYFGNYERWSVPWRMALGEVDGEAVIIILHRDTDVGTVKGAVRLDCLSDLTPHATRTTHLSGSIGPLVRQDLLKRPLNPIDFFADHSDRLLVFQWLGHRSNSFHRASYLMIPSPNEVEPRASLVAFSVNAADEPSGEPGKHQTKHHLNRNAIGCAVKLGKRESVDRFTHPKRCEQYSCSEQIYFQALHWLQVYGIVASVTCPRKVDGHLSPNDLSMFPRPQSEIAVSVSLK